jgi:cupin 2 domain-containing protein
MNLFEGIPRDLPEELFTEILSKQSLRIERIVSQGHGSAPDFWYDQSEHEWLIVLQGVAELQYEGVEMKVLKVGDYEFIPAGTKHRVGSTSSDPKCIWLAIFFEVESDE